MKVGHDEVCILKLDVRRRCSEEQSAQSTAHKHRHKSYGKQTRRGEADTGTPDRSKPIERFNRRRYGDQQGGQGEYRAEEWVHSADEHVMAPNNETEDRDGDHRIDHHAITEDRLAAK